MCYLQETTSDCGHVQTSLFMVCKHAESLTRTSDIYAPKFFLKGFTVVKDVTLENSCGSSDTDICNPLQTTALTPLLERNADEIANCATRIFDVKFCLDNGKRPLYNFHQVFEKGGNAQAEQRRQDVLWNIILPEKTNKLVGFFEEGCNKITRAYTLTVNTVLKSAFHPHLTDPHFAWFEEVACTVIAKSKYEAIRLDMLAVEACMDDVGWSLPEDEYAKDRLERMMVCRLVQPIEQSGTAVREQFVFAGHRRPEHTTEDENTYMVVAA